MQMINEVETLSEVCNRMSVDRNTLARLRKLPDFPKPLVGRCLFWRVSEIEAWQSSQALFGWEVMWKNLSSGDRDRFNEHANYHLQFSTPITLVDILDKYFSPLAVWFTDEVT